MKTASRMFTVFSLSLPLLFLGCSQSEPTIQPGRFNLMFAPPQSKAPDLLYLVDTATGRVWSMGIKREVNNPTGESTIEYSGWTEASIFGK